MTPLRAMAFLPSLSVAALVLVGCGRQQGQEAHDEAAHGHASEHGHGEASPSGASFKEGKGVILTDETRQILGVEVADLVERQLPNQINFTVQVFGEKHHHLVNQEDHSGCDVYGSGFVSPQTASVVQGGQRVELLKSTNTLLAGVVLAVQKALALGESEIVVGVSNATAALKSGEFIPARIYVPRDKVVKAIPPSSILRTAEGTFVYTVNGDAYFRTPVKIGVQTPDWVEITEGLLVGDQVVTKPVQTLWLIELRATKGGGHSH